MHSRTRAAAPVDARDAAASGTARAPRLLFVVSDCPFFVSHRLALAKAAVEAGFEVAIACPDSPAVARLRAEGLVHIPIALRRSNRRLPAEIRGFWSIFRTIRAFRPDAVHLITVKPIIYGGISARLLGVPALSAVTGLGHFFIHEGRAMRLLRRLLVLGYGLAMNHRRSHIIFQNGSDLEIFRRARLLSRARHSRIAGSGTDLDRIRPAPLPEGPVVVVMPSRLLRDKGVLEFVQAAGLLRARGHDAVFRLLGDPDDNNPTSVSVAELEDWVARGLVEWHRHTADINGALARAHIVVLPSHREGFPKTLIDAAAAGRAAAASDVPGCRDAIVPGETGVLFAVRDPADMARVLDGLIRDRALQARMGAAARRHAEACFDVRDVCRKHLEVYRGLVALGGAPAEAGPGDGPACG